MKYQEPPVESQPVSIAPLSAKWYQVPPSRCQPLRTPFSVDMYHTPLGSLYQPTGTYPSAVKA